MRTPTVFLRVGAAFGNQAAQRKLEGREALKPLTLKEIRNNKKGAWAPAPPMFTAFHIPRAKTGAASLPRACVPATVANVLRPPVSIVKTSDTSWLHHGWGASPAKESPSIAGSTLDRQAASLIQSERQLTSFFGENDTHDVSTAGGGLAPLVNRTLMDSRENTPITFMPARNGSAPEIPPVDYDSDTPTVDYNSDVESDLDSDDGSIGSVIDSDSDDEWDYVSPSEMIQAKRLFDQETCDIRKADQASALLQSRPAAGNTAAVQTESKQESTAPLSDANTLTLIEEIRAAKDTLKLRKVEVSEAPRIVESSGVPDERSMLASFNSFDSIHKLTSESDADTSGYLTDRSEPDFSV
ncbi:MULTISPECIES: hypothetical protein [Stenotrophomonas]|uniref:hypothetical protein n=1 Tax=Stenotrophomonas TaxID=40323 RepID=UPI000872EA35|nr:MULTISPECIES: hypothetical protein [Stenotrophomonas]OEZ01046.1 hypothetical protein BIY45_08540 [Stenotrophomonas sp. BIIR7]